MYRHLIRHTTIALGTLLVGSTLVFAASFFPGGNPSFSIQRFSVVQFFTIPIAFKSHQQPDTSKDETHASSTRDKTPADGLLHEHKRGNGRDP